MLTLDDDAYQHLLKLPTPIAKPALACLNAGSPAELAGTLHFFSRCTLGYLHALAVKANAVLNSESIDPTTDPGVDQFRKSWSWSCPDQVLLAWARLGRSGNRVSVPATDLDALSGLRENLNRCRLLAAARHWAQLIDALSEEAEQQLASRSLNHPAVIRELELVLRFALCDCLFFLQDWALCQIDDHDGGARQSNWQVDFVGPVPRKSRSPASAGPLRSGLYAAVAGHSLIALEPFCCFQSLEQSAGTRPLTPHLETGRTLKVLTNLDDGNVDFAAVNPQLIRRENYLWPKIRDDLVRCVDPLQRTSVRLKWGVCAIRVARTRELNRINGYETVNKVLDAMGRHAVAYTQGQSPIVFQPAAHPFFRHADEIVALFSHHQDSLEPQVWSCVLEFASGVIASVYRDLPAGFQGLCFDVGVIPRLNAEAETKADHFAHHAQLAIDHLDQQMLAARGNNKDAKVLWNCFENDSAQVYQREEPAFYRVSKASFAIIWRRAENGTVELLLRFNKRHGSFNLIGGHDEVVDDGQPERTLRRELREEIGLAESGYTMQSLFPCVVRRIQYSEPFQAQSCYFHHFFVVLADAAEGLLDGCDLSGCEWFACEPLSQGDYPDNVSRFPLDHLQDALKGIAGGQVPKLDFQVAKAQLLGLRPS